MVKVWVVVVTVILIIFTTVYIVGLRAMANEEPRLEGFGPEDAEKAEGNSEIPKWQSKRFQNLTICLVGGPNFQPSTVNHFIKAAISGVMPGGVKTEQPLFPKEYLQQFSTKYVEWAPAPFDKLPPPAMEAIGPMPGGPMPGDSPPPIIRVMHVISGMDRMFSMALNKQLTNLEPSFKAMRSRVCSFSRIYGSFLIMVKAMVRHASYV